MKAATSPLTSKPGGSACSTSTSDNSSAMPDSRARISSLRATSMPFRSSRGSGSVKPLPRAMPVASEKAIPSSNLPKMKEREPDRTPSKARSLSPALIRFCRFSMTGRPAPTLVSYRNLRRVWRAVRRSAL
ncbi:hypothetical protein D3C80_1510870 [compost metagenome]